MGRVTAVRDSEWADVFLRGEYTLLAGRHIQPEDENKILISAELAAENSLEIGDVLTLTHAGLGQQDGEYIDTILEKTAFAQVEIVGIFQCGKVADSADAPTAGKAANHMYSDSHLLVHLRNSRRAFMRARLPFTLPILWNWMRCWSVWRPSTPSIGKTIFCERTIFSTSRSLGSCKIFKAWLRR